MIHVLPDYDVIQVRGMVRYKDLATAIRRATRVYGKREWLLVFYPPEDPIQGIHTSMPFSPPDERPEVGFKWRKEE